MPFSFFSKHDNRNNAQNNWNNQQPFGGRRQNGYSFWDHIKCPYCFNEFSHNEVAFRSETGFSQNFLDEKQMEYEREADELKRIGLSQIIDNAKRYLIQPDRTYQNFWREMVGDENYENDDFCQQPVINVSEAASLIFDNDGFLSAIKDGAGVMTERRICPYCHNLLPKFYGKNEIKFMSVIGITSSGKTVYLSQLIDNLEDDLDKVGCSVIYSKEATDFRKKHIIRRGYPLPVGTVVRFIPPLYFTIQRPGRSVTLVTYDIAGEACADAEQVATYGKFIKNSDAIMMLIDPGQFKGLHASLESTTVQMSSDDSKASPTTVISAIHNAFMGVSSEQSPIPMATIISKSDVLMNLTDNSGDVLIPYQSMVRQDVTQTMNRSFNAAEYSNIEADITSMIISQYPALHTTITNNFARYGYFAVSALGCDVEEISDGSGTSWAPISDPIPLRIEEPIFWILRQWGVIG